MATAALLLTFAAVVGQVESASVASARAGFAEVDITPPVGIDLGGRGCSGEASSELLDTLSAQATVLADGRGSKLAIVSLDLIGLAGSYGERLRADIAARLGVPPANVLVNCSHTHSGPMMNRETLAACGEPTELERRYLADLAAKVVDICGAAERGLQPVRVAVHEGTSDVGINRRNRGPNGEMAMLPHAAGPYERRVWILQMQTPEGRPAGVWFSYPCHPVIVYGYARRGISGEFPSFARREIRAALGSGVHVQFLQGCAGDIRPRVTADLDKGRFRKTTAADRDRAGRDLAAAVLAGLKQPGRTLTLDIAARTTRVELKRGKPPAESFYANVAKGDDYRARAARYWLEEYSRGGPTNTTTNWAIGVVRLSSDQWMCWMGGEPVVEWTPLVRAWFDGRPVVTFGYTQEVPGYLPVDTLLDEGGYEVTSSNYFRTGNPAPFAPGLNDAVRRGVGAMLRDIEGLTTSRP
ncbi:MAG: hypothetical protein HY718_09660 [Planctomycetes bacterium]|nr:hypothetical protein [Planctomycetota bacterium]